MRNTFLLFLLKFKSVAYLERGLEVQIPSEIKLWSELQAKFMKHRSRYATGSNNDVIGNLHFAYLNSTKIRCELLNATNYFVIKFKLIFVLFRWYGVKSLLCIFSFMLKLFYCIVKYTLIEFVFFCCKNHLI